mgnify:CR=1 FL=1
MSYPDTKDPRFYKKLNTKFSRFTIPKKKKTFKQICFPDSFQLQIPQKFLAQYINPNSPYRGVLIYHRIGAGKTCTAVNIGEKWKEHRRVVVVTPASLKGNFKNELRSLCAGNNYLSDKERKLLKELHPKSKEYQDIIKVSDKRIDQHYTVLSYNKFVELSNEGDLNLRNSVLIVDEVQNMVSATGSFYETLYETIHNAPSSLRIVLLSATPMFDKPLEIALTMNLLRLPKELPIGKDFEKMFIKIRKSSSGRYIYNAKNLDIFKDRIKGYVSFFRGAPPYAFPEGIIRYKKVKMSPFQYKTYLTVLASEEKDNKKLKKIKDSGKIFRDGDIIKIPNNFFIGSRVVSNIAFPNKMINEKGLESLEGKCLTVDCLEKFSPKFHKILKKINRCSGTVFVYSNFKEHGGIKTFVKILEAHGYKDYRKFGEGKKRFAIWSGDESTEVKEEIKAVFNNKNNFDGSKLKIMLGSPSIKEGVSLLRVQQVHILEPYWNQSRLDQVIGRAIRYCSHKDMPLEKRAVKVYIYIAWHPKEKESIDQYIQKLASTKKKLISQFESALKESAVDCTLFKHANVYSKDEDIQCEV